MKFDRVEERNPEATISEYRRVLSTFPGKF